MTFSWLLSQEKVNGSWHDFFMTFYNFMTEAWLPSQEKLRKSQLIFPDFFLIFSWCSVTETWLLSQEKVDLSHTSYLTFINIAWLFLEFSLTFYDFKSSCSQKMDFSPAKVNDSHMTFHRLLLDFLFTECQVWSLGCTTWQWQHCHLLTISLTQIQHTRQCWMHIWVSGDKIHIQGMPIFSLPVLLQFWFV